MSKIQTTCLLIAMLVGLIPTGAFAMLHPQQGRFMQRDPLGYVDGMNVYEYIGDTSINDLDPSGNCSVGCASGAMPWVDISIGESGPTTGPTTNPAQHKKCVDAVNAAMNNPKIKKIVDALKRKNCHVPTVSCICCGSGDTKIGGGFNPRTKDVEICEDRMGDREGNMIDAVAHEMIHAYDDCSGYKWDNCDDRACSEVRAYNLSGNCAKGSGWRRAGESYRDCIKRNAANSVSADPKCGDGTASVNKVFSRCFKDRSPLE